MSEYTRAIEMLNREMEQLAEQRSQINAHLAKHGLRPLLSGAEIYENMCDIAGCGGEIVLDGNDL